MLRAAPILLAVIALSARACPPPTPQPPVASTSAPVASAPPAPQVAWKPKSFARTGEGCTQMWSCDCAAVAARAGCHVEGTREEPSQGVCAADSGPVNGCTRCMALPPAATCACNQVCP